ncbi:MAG: Gx transporter family protein [Calditrichia bacterium]
MQKRTTRALKQSPDKTLNLRDARIAGLVVVGLLLFIFESYLPRPVPWLKFGLANIATLVALYWLGWKEAIIVALYRIVIGAFFIGNIFTPGFFLSLSGGLMAVLAMVFFFQLKIFGIVSVSVAGSVFHNLGQVLVAVYLLFKNSVIWYILPYLLLTSLFTGVVIGLISFYLLKRIGEDFGD